MLHPTWTGPDSGHPYRGVSVSVRIPVQLLAWTNVLVCPDTVRSDRGLLESGGKL